MCRLYTLPFSVPLPCLSDLPIRVVLLLLPEDSAFQDPFRLHFRVPCQPAPQLCANAH